jgi:hypothetical protein
VKTRPRRRRRLVPLAECTWVEARTLARDRRAVILLPLGAVEEHGPHLPLLVDWLGAEELARRLAGTGQRDADVGVLGLAWAVDDAAHHGEVEGLDARILLAPNKHALALIGLDLAGELLEHGRGGAPAAGAGRDGRHERAQPHGLQNLLRHPHLLRAVAARLRGKRDADRVADALLQQDAHAGGGGDDALGAHPGFGQPQMQGIATAGRQHCIHADQILHRAHLRRDDDLLSRHPERLGALGRQQRRLHDRLVHDGTGLHRRGGHRVLVHQAGEQLLIQAAPVDADAHRLLVCQCQLDDGRVLPVALGLEADVDGIEAVLGERLGAGGVVCQQGVAVVMEVADQRHRHTPLRQPVADVRHGLGGLAPIDGDAHDLGASAGQLGRLARGSGDVGRIGVGHRLHDDRRAAADDDAADSDRNGGSTRKEEGGHRFKF